MAKYEELKKSSDGMPTWDSLIPVAVEVMAQRKQLARKELVKAIMDIIDIPDELRNKVYKNENNRQQNSIFDHRVGWAISSLKQAGIIDYPKRGLLKITQLGRELYEKHGDSLDAKILKSQPQYIEHMKLQKERKQRAPNEDLKQTIKPNVNTAGEVVKQQNLFVSKIHIEKVRHLENVDILLSDTVRKHLINYRKKRQW